MCLFVWLAAVHNLAEPPFSLSPTPLSISLSFAFSPCCLSAGIFHHLVPSVSSHQSGANLGSQQRHLDTNPKPGASFLPSGSSQPSRTQTVLHVPSPPAHSLPPPPPLLNTTSSSAPSQPSPPSLTAASSNTSGSSRPFAVHYSPHLLPPHPSSSAGSGVAGALGSWRTLGMQGSYVASQNPGSRPR